VTGPLLRMPGRIRPLAGVPDEATLHTLRHSFASLAADFGYGDAAIAGPIGHTRGGVTARHTHRSDKVLPPRVGTAAPRRRWHRSPSRGCCQMATAKRTGMPGVAVALPSALSTGLAVVGC
jgi:hypothetical protein